jgi:hypothetical protein
VKQVEMAGRATCTRRPSSTRKQTFAHLIQTPSPHRRVLTMHEARRTHISQPINICCGLCPYKSAAAEAIQLFSRLCSWLRKLLLLWHQAPDVR